MKNESAATSLQMVRFERTYDGPVDDLWDLWTTKDGFESWWGPEGFRVEVSKIEPRVGGTLDYDMIAARAEEIAYMNKEGWAVRHGTHGTFVEFEPSSRTTTRCRWNSSRTVHAFAWWSRSSRTGTRTGPVWPLRASRAS